MGAASSLHCIIVGRCIGNLPDIPSVTIAIAVTHRHWYKRIWCIRLTQARLSIIPVTRACITLDLSRSSRHARPNGSRSFLIVEVHDTLGRPLFFLKSEGIQSIACRAILLESIRHTWPYVAGRAWWTKYDFLSPPSSDKLGYTTWS